MKRKKIEKKLVLKRETISNLSKHDQAQVVGGGLTRPVLQCATNFETCDTCEISCYLTGIYYTCTTSVPFLNC